MPNASSPGSKLVRLLPTASTVPARLRPGLRCFGRRSPNLWLVGRAVCVSSRPAIIALRQPDLRGTATDSR
jgi:hypothetical protein